MTKTLLERFEDKVMVDPNSGCWLWTACIAPNGYGLFHNSETQMLEGAHRFSYKAFRGEIPNGLNLDHLCRVRACVNPHHLEPVTHAENVRRGLSPAMFTKAAIERGHAKTHCPSGHPFSEENTYIYNSPTGPHRACRICRRAAVTKQNAKRKRAACST